MTDSANVPSQSDEANVWVDVMPADQLADDAASEVIVDGSVVAVFRSGGKLYALDGMCAHQGGPIAEGVVTPDVQGNPCVTCPWHGWQYELATGIQTVNRQPLMQTYEVREHDGMIQVNSNLT